MRASNAGFDGRAAILVPHLAPNDAVGNDTLGLERALLGLGVDVRIFAAEGDPNLARGSLDEARDFVSTGRPLAFLQLATAWETGLEIFARTRGVRIVRDHNVTPGRFFAGLSPYFVELQERAARQRAELARGAENALFLAASPVNRAELIESGVRPERVAVVAPFTPLEELLSAEPDRGMLERLRRDSPVALFVGRIAPHKGQRRALRVAAAYRELFGERLLIRFVGSVDGRLSFWRDLIERDAERLGLARDFEILSGLDLAALKAAYLASDVFLSCSEHEGFCIPIVEAAALGVPIVAAHERGIAETLRRGGLVVDDRSDDVIAAAVRKVLSSSELRTGLVDRNRQAAASFARESTERALREALSPILGEAR